MFYRNNSTDDVMAGNRLETEANVSFFSVLNFRMRNNYMSNVPMQIVHIVNGKCCFTRHNYCKVPRHKGFDISISLILTKTN